MLPGQGRSTPPRFWNRGNKIRSIRSKQACNAVGLIDTYALPIIIENVAATQIRGILSTTVRKTCRVIGTAWIWCIETSAVPYVIRVNSWNNVRPYATEEGGFTLINTISHELQQVHYPISFPVFIICNFVQRVHRALSVTTVEIRRPCCLYEARKIIP
jgi:hypothetical protein